MQEELNDILTRYQAAFVLWPEAVQKKFMQIVTHYCNNDEKKFTELCLMVEDWAGKDREVPPLLGYPNELS